MLFVLFSQPSQTKAVWSFDSVYAQAPSIDITSLNQTSSTMELPMAKVSPASVSQDKGANKDDKINADVNIISDNAILPLTGPMGVSDEKTTFDSSSLETSFYVVRKGDSLSAVAEMFDISIETILSANDLEKGAKLQEGDVLLILSLDAIEHSVAKGETLKGIAVKYKVDLQDILNANDIDIGTKLVVGEKLMIPGGKILTGNVTKSTKTGIARGNSQIYSVAPGYFVNPVLGAIRTRGITKTHQGVDLAAPKGTPILAAASGTVIIARNGYNGGFGNYAVIQHHNGTKTLYAHMSKLGTTPGAHVSQGEVIGYVGNTGRSRGDHLHIEVLGGKNVF